jgi:histidine triad (HIT) family protein
MSDCIFCKIVAGEMPALKILEDKDFLAFIDIRPVHLGHTLVIPKKHCENILDFPKADESDLLEFVKKVARAVVKGTGAHGFNLSMNNGEAAGQAVFHAHFHIIPRFYKDNLSNWPHERPAQAQLNDIHKKIKNAL